MLINDYLLNIISGRFIIGSLYDAITNARRICSIGGNYTYKFSLLGFGSKRYRECELIKLDESYRCVSLENIINKKVITLDDMIIILLKGRSEFRKLYGSFYQAENSISNAKILCYTFNNPYSININKDRIQLSAKEILDIFDKARYIQFNPSLIII